MKNILFILILITSMIACKAQQTYPYNTDYDQIPNGSYLKDLNNELSPYIGTYKASYQGNEITLFITKQENKNETRPLNKQFYRDALVVKYIVKNSLNNVLQDTYNNNIPNIELYSYRIRTNQNTIILYYSGTNCGVGWGDIYLKKINATQISWEYRPEDMVLTSENCSGNPDITIYLPEIKDLIFTKQ